MTALEDYDIAIIGAGVAGLSAAYFLSPHARVVVLERESQPAYHSSGRSAALFIEGYENPVVSELTRASKDFYFDPPPDFAEASLVHPRGGLTAAGPGEEKALRRYLEVWQPLCPELHPVDPEGARALVPILRPDWVTGGAYDPSWRSIDVHELLMGFQRGLKRHGGTLHSNAPVGALRRSNERWTIDAGEQQLTAGVVVNASGAWANATAAMAGAAELPLTPMRRTAAIVPAPEGAASWPLLHTIAGNLYFKPESPGLMVCPQDETPSAPMDAFPEDLDVAVALDRFTTVTSHAVERVLHQWAGLRTFAPDRFPVLGFDAGAPDFFWLAGQGGFGVQTAPRLGALAAGIILNAEPLADEVSVRRLR